ncbi:hypothetical protein GGTG_01693 [Gaeumannomyces tritici R3-111a-1]|uniref:Uncharacterized protein n=1 Tax=Gaeumannomyces tritici (strain R3-111a-1) TaxID=644352 RepID=J3NKB3_GAET3|nr:hypothetical protein GGTG_01693 [Gaeumannomyces tritici R3-111a-1]EJT81717.1 hypothetical protein GGTG_01693 [Gaeumannomyces tritici R3-111a-1]
MEPWSFLPGSDMDRGLAVRAAVAHALPNHSAGLGAHGVAPLPAAAVRFERGPAFAQGISTPTSASSNLLPSLFSVSTVRHGRIGDQFPQSKSNMAETDWQIRPILQRTPCPPCRAPAPAAWPVGAPARDQLPLSI